jgi:hypothetical protein
MSFLLVDDLYVHALLDEINAFLKGKYSFKSTFRIVNGKYSWEISKPEWYFDDSNIKFPNPYANPLWRIYFGYVYLERLR